ncbi:hypothetical protein EWM64_g9060 [Hericium alpestre]|uniref:Uncharacterized protein n=1 Tax=Hericium alpestre TaxID=135208 RepID=A0A4Y9ZLW4_9AGAM|nr:hypothetical protein EWM64_g9060 [Hericium alpestre]
MFGLILRFMEAIVWSAIAFAAFILVGSFIVLSASFVRQQEDAAASSSAASASASANTRR